MNLHILLSLFSKPSVNIQESQKFIKSLERYQELIKKSKSFVSCYHMSYCQQKHTTYQFTYFIYYLVEDKFKNPKLL